MMGSQWKITAEKETLIFRKNWIVDLCVQVCVLKKVFLVHLFMGDPLCPLPKFKIFRRKKIAFIFSLQGSLTTINLC